MKPDDPQTQNSTCNEPHIPQEIVLELLNCQLRNNISPLSLEIDCASLRAWSEEHTQERFRYQNLLRELRRQQRAADAERGRFHLFPAHVRTEKPLRQLRQQHGPAARHDQAG